MGRRWKAMTVLNRKCVLWSFFLSCGGNTHKLTVSLSISIYIYGCMSIPILQNLCHRNLDFFFVPLLKSRSRFHLLFELGYSSCHSSCWIFNSPSPLVPFSISLPYPLLFALDTSVHAPLLLMWFGLNLDPGQGRGPYPGQGWGAGPGLDPGPGQGQGVVAGMKL